ncbi:MAG: hypothetical protein GAK28_03978 [Luteibacter sp.]|uniref:hypothetical protein n=1 Tax=Luteibacter sp. TaxID=1886636 RepID=UPI0013842301|nr:hypothetical protein [Luteibacter sp.]KAF1004456.1 MAG: hypothetical protein GAK28_03978 [Luteibacter sp.]
MKKTALAIALGLFTAMAAHAQNDYSEALNKAATGPQFTVGSTTFRIIPDAGIQRAAPSGTAPAASARMNRSSGTQSQNADALGSVGPFVIVPRQPGVATQRAATSRSAASTKTADGNLDAFGVAVNTRSGQPVVVAPRVKVFANDAATSRKLAATTGGEVVQASDLDGSALIRYASVADAQAALAKIKGAKGVEDAQLDVIENFREKQ